MVFPIKAFLAGPVFSFLGGDCVFNSIAYTLAAGSTNDPVRRFVLATHMPKAGKKQLTLFKERRILAT
jgi:hypothetical protein